MTGRPTKAIDAALRAASPAVPGDGRARRALATHDVCRIALGLLLLTSVPAACGGGARDAGGSGGSSGAAGRPGGPPLGRGTGAAGGDTSPAASGGAGAAGGSAAAGGSSLGGARGVAFEGAPIFTRVPRLTVAQWERAVADVLRFTSSANLAQGFATPRTGAAADFDNNERLLFVDQQAQQDFETGAEKVAALATADAGALARVYAGTDASGFVRALGRRAFRRPLTPDEQKAYEGIFAAGEQLYGAGFANGAALVIRALLQAPAFLYRAELGPAGQPLDGYEIASKLSFSLLGTTPSDELLDDAAAGKLDTVDGLEGATRAMLERPDAVQVMRDFHGQLYHLDIYGLLVRTGLASDTRSELAETSRRFFDEIFARGEGLSAILTSTRYFVGPALATAYGVTPPSSPSMIDERVLDASRIGYFMQIPFLLAAGRDDGPDSIRRGDALAEDVLCLDLAPHATSLPPIPALAQGQTNRQRIEQLTAGCPGCHGDYIDPLGFAFEGFDGLGQPRTNDNGVLVNTAGRYPFEDGTSAFADARELMRALADAPQAHRCYARKLASYALGRDIVQVDRPWVESLAQVSRERSLKEMIVSLVRAPAFRMRPDGMP